LFRDGDHTITRRSEVGFTWWEKFSNLLGISFISCRTHSLPTIAISHLYGKGSPNSAAHIGRFQRHAEHILPWDREHHFGELIIACGFVTQSRGYASRWRQLYKTNVCDIYNQKCCQESFTVLLPFLCLQSRISVTIFNYIILFFLNVVHPGLAFLLLLPLGSNLIYYTLKII